MSDETRNSRADTPSEQKSVRQMPTPDERPETDGADGVGSDRVGPVLSTDKIAPEALEIRGAPPRVIRFRQEVIIGLTGLGVAILFGVAWFALRSHVPTNLPPENDLSRPLPKPASDALADLPQGYGDTPKLGPALPGDLGRPILNARNSEGERRRADAAAAEKADAERRAAEVRSARQSGLLAATRGAASGVPEVQSRVSERGAQAVTDSIGNVQISSDTEDRKTRFVERTPGRTDENPHILRPGGASTLSAGSVIGASLITGINSDTPGMVVAQVTQNVYDSATGLILLVPQGARLIGKYDSVVAYGQERALVIWQRLLMPDGSSLRLENMAATDASGQAGLKDRVDHHTGRLIGGVALASILGVGTELSISGEGELVRVLRQSAQSNTARAGDQITRRNLDVQPTITIRPGAPVRLVVQQDLLLKPWARED